jgi:hypothetical protein
MADWHQIGNSSLGLFGQEIERIALALSQRPLGVC